MKARTRRRRVRSQLLSGVSEPIDLTHDEVLADLDAGWADWVPERQGRIDRAGRREGRTAA